VYSSNVFASDTTESRIIYNELLSIHPKIGISNNLYSSSFNKFENSYDCGVFKSGKGIGFSAGLTLERKLSEDLSLGIGSNYLNRSGVFTLDSKIPAREITATNLSWITTENRLQTNLTFIEFFPELRYNLLDELINGPLRISGTFRLGIPIVHTFNQKEVILSPKNAKFISSGSNERFITEGIINKINPIHFGISIGIENLLKVSESNYFSQQIIFDYNLNKVTSDVDWNLYSIRLDLGFRFGIMEKQEILIPKEPVIEKPKTEPIIVIKDTVVPQPKLEIELIKDNLNLQIQTGNELLATLPLVNAIFFQSNSSEIPKDYLTKDTLLPSRFYGDAVENRKFILLRIANLVKNNPNAKITINGATSGIQNEPEGIELARKRAENIKTSLVNLGVPDSIIKTTYSLLPAFPSNQDYPEGKLENQRADILIHNAPLQEYVGFQKYAEVTGEINIRVTHENLKELNEIILEPFFYDTMIICPKPGIYNIPVKQRIDIDTDTFELSAEISYRNIIRNANIRLSKNDFMIIPKELLLKNFNAVLRFEYNSSELSPENKELLNQLVQRIPENSTIIINGSADALGSEQQNIQLATQRAKVAEDYINQITKSKFKIITDNKFLKHPEKTPEGRFFNRAISIRIQ
jgi:outer membrane protein OmpA-like peptidoglycan-associated protein